MKRKFNFNKTPLFEERLLYEQLHFIIYNSVADPQLSTQHFALSTKKAFLGMQIAKFKLPLDTVSVVGNAALVKSEVAYDSIDNAKLTPEQVADIILDMLDNDVFRWWSVVSG